MDPAAKSLTPDAFLRLLERLRAVICGLPSESPLGNLPCIATADGLVILARQRPSRADWEAT